MFLFVTTTIFALLRYRKKRQNISDTVYLEPFCISSSVVLLLIINPTLHHQHNFMNFDVNFS